MTKRAITILSVFLLAAMPTVFAESEFAIVTGQQGYLLNDRDQVVDSVIMGSAFRVTGEKGDYLIVEHLGEKLRLHKRLCLFSESWDDIDADSFEQIFAALKQLEFGLREQELGNNDRAIEVLHKAADAMDGKLPFRAWFRCFEAYIHYANEDYKTASTILAQSNAELQATGAKASIFKGDLLNTQALIKAGEGDIDEAVDWHEQALSASRGERPKNHVDVAILSSNLSVAYSAAQNYAAAVDSQKEALEIFQTIYPPSAKELPLETVRLADTYRDTEQYGAAVQFYESAVRNLITYHPHLVYEIASARESLIDAHRSLENYDASEKVCRDLIKSLRKFEFKDDIAYRKSAYQRLALINYDQENYAAALQHCVNAIELADQDNFDLVDAYTFEFGGDAYLRLERTQEAKVTYEKAVEIYIQEEGADSDKLEAVQAALAQIEADGANALNTVVLVAEPKGYLLDKNDNIITLVPALTVLKWISSEDNYHEVEFNGQVGRLSNAQLRTGRQIPGYGAVSVDSLKQVMAFAASANKAFDAGSRVDCQQALAEGKLACDSENIRETTLDYWHRLHVLTLIGQLDGTQTLYAKVEALESDVLSFDQSDYPIQIDYESTAAYVLADRGQADGLSKQQQSLKLTQDVYGFNHAVTTRARSRLAKIMVALKDYESAITEFGKVIASTQRIYPPKTPEFSKAIVDLSAPIVNTTDNEIATSILESILKQDETLTFQSQSLAMTMLGKVYADSGNTPAARTLFNAVIDAEKDDKDVPRLAITQAYLQSGQLDLRDKKWNSAIAALKESLAVYNENGAANSFAVTEVHRLLADAYEGAGDSQLAVVQLQTVLKIYDGLGGADSPRAKEIRDRLQKMGASPVREQSQPTFDIAGYFNFAPEGETMLIAQRTCSVFANVDGPSDKIIGKIEADSVVCSLEKRNGRHRVYIEDQQTFGWVKTGDFVLQEEILIKKAFADLDKIAGNSDRQRQEIGQNIGAIRSAFDALRQPQNAITPGDISTLENAIRLLKKHKQKNSFPYIVISADLAAMYARDGQTLKAAKLIDDQLSSLLSVVRYQHPLVAANRMKLATLAKQLGDDDKASSEIKTVISICEKHFGPNDPRTQFQRMGLAAIKVRQGLFDDARKAYKLQLDVEQGNSGPSLTLAAAHLGLASLEASTGNDQSSAEHANVAMKALQDMNFPIPGMTAQGLILLARGVGRGGEFQEALELLERVETLASQADPEAKLLTLIQQSTIAAHMNQANTALDFANTADAFAIKQFGENHFRRYDALQAAGRAQHHTNPARAADAYDKARQLSLDYLNDTVAYQNSSQQISFLHADEFWLEEALSLSADGKSAIKQTTTWMLNFHNLLPRVLARERQARAHVNDRSEYNALYLSGSERTKRANLPLLSLTESNQLQMEEVAADIAAEEQSYARNLPTRPKQVMNEQLPWITPAEVQQQLADDEVLVMIREVRHAYKLEEDPFGGVPPSEFDRRSYMTWIVSGESVDLIDAFQLPNDVRTVQTQIDAVTRFVSEINAASRLGQSPSAKRSSNFQKDLERLSDSVWKPISQRLRPTVRKVTLCLDGSLHRIPWEALSTRPGQIVLDDFSLRYISSPRDLLPRATQSEAGPAAVLVKSSPIGQEDLSTYAPSSIDHINRQTSGSSHPFTSEIRSDLLNMSVLSPAGEDDVVQLALPFVESFGEESTVYKENEASELRYYLLKNPQALHIAAYSMVTPSAKVRDISFLLSQSRPQIESPSKQKANPLLRCCLALAGFDIKDTPQHLLDGILTGEEIVTNDLSGTELVTLSYGPRSIADNIIDDTSILIPQAFLLAGAHSVIAPQWQPDEAASLAILKSFYEKLATGQSKADALRAAQLEFREASKRRGHDHPMYWAAFRLTGQR